MQIKWGGLLCVFIIILCFALFFVFYPTLNKSNQYIRALKTKNQVEVFEVFIYAVEVARFQNEGKATSYAEMIKDKGGAGYIYIENDYYHILTSLYFSESDANTVATKLKNNSFKSVVMPIIIPHTYISVSTASESLATTLGQTFELLEGIQGLIIELSNKKIDIKSAINGVNRCRNEITAVTSAFNSTGLDTVKNTAIRAFYMNIVSKLDELITSADESSELLTELHYLSLDTIIKFNELLTEIK